MAVSVKMDTFTDRICTKGQNGHINLGRSHLCSTAAWNWKGMENNPIMTSAIAKLPTKFNSETEKVELGAFLERK